MVYKDHREPKESVYEPAARAQLRFRAILASFSTARRRFRTICAFMLYIWR